MAVATDMAGLRVVCEKTCDNMKAWKETDEQMEAWKVNAVMDG